MKKMTLVTLMGLFLLVLPLRAQFKLLHSFAGGAGDGQYPYGSLIAAGGVLYGMTQLGGDSDGGTVFKINSDGSDFSLLHSFAGGVGDGRIPHDSLIESGEVLYGMTVRGGDTDEGTVFKINSDGSGFSLLHSFAGGGGDGQHPLGSLIAVGGVLYGMTQLGGDSDGGTVFKINSDGSGFSLLHSFHTEDGICPLGSLIESGGVLYGMTRFSGPNTRGTVFKINHDGSGFALLHSFSGEQGDGNYPANSLVEMGGTLFGMTEESWDLGAIFKISPDGSDFSLIHSFDGAGCSPRSSLVAADGVLYGMTNYDFTLFNGTIFKITPDGSSFSLLHRFTGNKTDGSKPEGSLIEVNGKLYGMTPYGGDSGFGVIFSLDHTAPPPTIQVLSPNGGESWKAGSAHDITWSSSGLDKVCIILWEKNGVCGAWEHASFIARDVSAALGAYTWNIPTTQSVGSNYGIQIVNWSFGDTGEDWGDDVFAIVPNLTVLSPNGGESWPLGSSRPIIWNYGGLSGNVRLVLFRNNVKVGTIATVPIANKVYNWVAGAYSGGTAVAAKNYRIKVVAVDDVYSDSSDANFTLSLTPFVQVVSPNGGESWARGSSKAITWKCGGVTGNVRLVLFNGNTKVGTIATVAASPQGSYSWTVGNYIGGSAPAGSNYKIKVVTIDNLYADYSDGTFAITATGGGLLAP